MIEPRRVLAIHLAIIAGFALSNVLIAAMEASGHRSLLGFSRMMGLGEESNIPSIFSALALAACAVTANTVRSRLAGDDPDRVDWGVLAVLFAFMALDEAVMIHELGNRLGRTMGLTGPFRNIGAFLYIPVVLWLAVRLFAFWLRLEPRLRRWFLLAGVTFVLSAIGVEMFENELRSHGLRTGDPLIRVSFIFEECGEMLAVALFLYVFLTRFSMLGGGMLIPLEVRGDPEESGRVPDRVRSAGSEYPGVTQAIVLQGGREGGDPGILSRKQR